MIRNGALGAKVPTQNPRWEKRKGQLVTDTKRTYLKLNERLFLKRWSLSYLNI